MRPKAAECLLLLLMGIYPSVVVAQRLDVLTRLCIGPGVVPPSFEKPLRIPVGCEIIDCCPGCPGGGLIELRVQVESPIVEGAELRFTGMSAERLRQLKIGGSAKLNGSRILVGRGASTIAGFPRAADGRVTVASLRPILRSASSAKFADSDLAPANRTDVDADGTPANIHVEQFLGAYAVNYGAWRWIFYRCRPPRPARDRLQAQNIAGGDNVVVMLDTRIGAGASGCSDDQVLRTTNTLSFANLLLAAGCNSEISIFAANNAMSLETPVTTWTNSTGDLHTSSLQPIINMPVSVWIANNAAAPIAVNDIANANYLYSINKIGVEFTPTYNNVSGNAAAVNTIGLISCGAVGPIRGSAFYTANALNIYYINAAFTGENCARTLPVGDGNISYIGTAANLASLAHEIGHAFGLRPAGSGGHTNGLPGFASNNIMWGGGPVNRDNFTVGQAFRINTHSDVWGGTMLINDGLRPGPGRACPPLTTSTTCPAIALDWLRP